MKHIILGTGYVSQGYQRALAHLGHKPIVVSRHILDYIDPILLHLFLEDEKPDYVINCAGYTGETVDDCEKNKDQCYHGNVTFPVNVAKVTGKLGIPLLHMSSGCIFDGPGRFTETSDPGPQMSLPNFYAQCKYEAEEDVPRFNRKSFLFRIRMPFSHWHHPRNWLDKLMKYDRILDGLNSVTWLDEFCMRSLALVSKSDPGIYHAVQPLPLKTSWVARQLRDNGLKDDFTIYDPDEFLKHHVKRSAAELSPHKFEEAVGASSTDAARAIKWCISQMLAEEKSGVRQHERRGNEVST